MADKDNWLLALGASRRYTDLSTTSGLQSISTVELPNGTVVLRCVKTDGTIVDLPMNGLLTSLQKAWVQEHYDKLAFNTATNQLEYNGSPIESIITEDIISTVNCGAIKVGDKVSKNSSLTDFAKKLLIQDLAPKVTIESDLDYVDTVYERGIQINPALTITVSKVNYDDADISNITLTSDPSDSTYNMVDNSPDANLNTITKNVTLSDTVSYTAKATNEIGKIGSKTAKFVFVDPIYYGGIDQTKNITTISGDDILAGTKVLADIDTDQELTEFYTVSMQKMFIAYPKVFGELTSIKDVNNGFELLTGFEKVEVNITTVDNTIVPYYCYLGVTRSNVTDFETYFKW